MNEIGVIVTCIVAAFGLYLYSALVAENRKRDAQRRAPKRKARLRVIRGGRS